MHARIHMCNLRKSRLIILHAYERFRVEMSHVGLMLVGSVPGVPGLSDLSGPI